MYSGGPTIAKMARRGKGDTQGKMGGTLHKLAGRESLPRKTSQKKPSEGDEGGASCSIFRASSVCFAWETHVGLRGWQKRRGFHARGRCRCFIAKQRKRPENTKKLLWVNLVTCAPSVRRGVMRGNTTNFLYTCKHSQHGVGAKGSLEGQEINRPVLKASVLLPCFTVGESLAGWEGEKNNDVVVEVISHMLLHGCLHRQQQCCPLSTNKHRGSWCGSFFSMFILCAFCCVFFFASIRGYPKVDPTPERCSFGEIWIKLALV